MQGRQQHRILDDMAERLTVDIPGCKMNRPRAVGFPDMHVGVGRGSALHHGIPDTHAVEEALRSRSNGTDTRVEVTALGFRRHALPELSAHGLGVEYGDAKTALRERQHQTGSDQATTDHDDIVCILRVLLHGLDDVRTGNMWQ